MSHSKKSVSCKSILTKSATGGYFLGFSAEVGKHFKTDARTRRVVCTLNCVHTFQCALLPNKGEFCVGVSKAIREKLGLVEGDTVHVLLEPDTSKYGAPMSEEFEEVLRQDPDGALLFHALTAGKQ